jgi:hypothetical protein
VVGSDGRGVEWKGRRASVIAPARGAGAGAGAGSGSGRAGGASGSGVSASSNTAAPADAPSLVTLRHALDADNVAAASAELLALMKSSHSAVISMGMREVRQAKALLWSQHESAAAGGSDGSSHDGVEICSDDDWDNDA